MWPSDYKLRRLSQQSKMKTNTQMINWEKTNGLVPVVVQDNQTLEVLMLAYMNSEALEKTQNEGKVTFFSRTRNRLWTKGEESGNFLFVKSLHIDCDRDTILIKVNPAGPTCHTGVRTCFNTDFNQNFLFELEKIIANRYENPVEGSYINKMRRKGLNKIAQKVGEEGIETVIAALAESEEAFAEETADLLFHLMFLLKEKGLSLASIAKKLENRH